MVRLALPNSELKMKLTHLPLYQGTGQGPPFRETEYERDSSANSPCLRSLVNV